MIPRNTDTIFSPIKVKRRSYKAVKR